MVKLLKQHRTCAWLAKAWFSSKQGKKLYKRTDLLLKRHWVFEWAPGTYRQRGKNPGVGVACANVLRTPSGESVSVQWSDGEKETMEKGVLRVAPNPGMRFQCVVDQLWYRISKYGDLASHHIKDDFGHGVIVLVEVNGEENDESEERDTHLKLLCTQCGGPTTGQDMCPQCLKLLCTQCGLPTTGQHACPQCKKGYHTTCMLSFNSGRNKICWVCYDKGANSRVTVKWTPDRHLHNPWGNGEVPYCPFTREYFEQKDANRKKKDSGSRKRHTRSASSTATQSNNKCLKRSRWKRCRAPALTIDMCRALNTWFRKVCGPKPHKGIYTVYQRVVRKFVVHNTTYDKDLVDTAITEVRDEMPSKGYTFEDEQIHKCLQHLFGAGETQEGGADETEEGECKTSDPAKITLEQCVENLKMMQLKVQWLIGLGDEEGYPKRSDDVPDCSSMYAQKVKAHKLMTYLDKRSVYKALEKLRDMGLFPVVMKDTPHGRWCNFAQVLYTFAILYCHYQGELMFV